MVKMSAYHAMLQILSVNETLETLKNRTMGEIPDPIDLKVMELMSEYRNLLCMCMEKTELLVSFKEVDK